MIHNLTSLSPIQIQERLVERLQIRYHEAPDEHNLRMLILEQDELKYTRELNSIRERLQTQESPCL